MIALDPAFASAADRFSTCGHKTVAVLACSNQINHLARPIYEHCDNRVCPRCASRLSARLLDHYTRPIEDLIAAHPRPGYRLRHIVLTTDVHPMQATADIKFDHLSARIEPTIRDCLCPRHDDESIHAWHRRWAMKKRTIGLLVCAEFGEDGHRLHFHLAYYGPFIPQAVLSQTWEQKTGYPVVYIHNRQDHPIADVLRETLKYVTKFAIDGQAADPHLIARIHQILFGHRRVRSYGLFFNIPEPTQDDQQHGTCPECQSELVELTLGKFLERTHTHIQALEMFDTTPDMTNDVLYTLAAIAACSYASQMYTARRQWGEVWAGLAVPDPDRYVIDHADRGP